MLGVAIFALVRGVTLVHFTEDDYSTFTATRQHELYVGATRVFHWGTTAKFEYGDQIAPSTRPTRHTPERSGRHGTSQHVGWHSQGDPDQIRRWALATSTIQYAYHRDVVLTVIDKMPKATRDARRDVALMVFDEVDRRRLSPAFASRSLIDNIINSAVLQYQIDYRELNADGHSKDYDLPAGKH